MAFGHQHILLLCVGIIPVLMLFYWYSFRRRKRLLSLFAEQSLLVNLLRNYSLKSQIAKTFMISTGIILLLFALSRPQWGMVERPLMRKGVDLIICIDTSNSMLASDIKPNRITRAKMQLESFVRNLKGHRVGIVPFAGDCVLTCPLTLDYEIAMKVIGNIDTDIIPIQGTAIGRTLRKVIQFFDKKAPTHKIIILLTDGEDQGTDLMEAANECAKANIQIYAIGIGSADGAPIVLPDGAMKEDSSGKKILTRMDFKALQDIALATGGKAIIANPSGDLELQEILKSIDNLDKALLESKKFNVFEDRFQWFLLPAILLFILEPLRSERTNGRIKRMGLD